MCLTFFDWFINFTIDVFILMFGVGICCIPFLVIYKIINYFLDKYHEYN